MNSIYTLFLVCFLHIQCTNIPTSQTNGKITGKWLPVKSIISATENDEKSFEKTDSSFVPSDVMLFKENGTIDDGGQRYESYTIDRETKELTLQEANGDAITFRIQTLTAQQLVIFREDDEIYNNKHRHMKLEIHFKRP
ncbi:hypothetical protein ACTJJ0_20715 [Chitinophaga sp. 22321]|uniref:Lipocalin-like domain-containing protein n=1 Tax=Chitinophaga hostae TaxID=2831022 RepID=A0ABS5J4A7_9BACT|nr:hypothetical protein [Chitinophaga hostae]MBS0029908.1 hypothetical protein [Chitinophaga hostae]